MYNMSKSCFRKYYLMTQLNTVKVATFSEHNTLREGEFYVTSVQRNGFRFYISDIKTIPTKRLPAQKWSELA